MLWDGMSFWCGMGWNVVLVWDGMELVGIFITIGIAWVIRHSVCLCHQICYTIYNRTFCSMKEHRYSNELLILSVDKITYLKNFKFTQVVQSLL